MHVPDGFLSLPVIASFGALSAAVVAYSAWQARKTLDKNRAATLALLSALVFAAQMLNFPVLGGTSGHVLGGALLALAVGFYPSVVAMALMLAVQALVFHDGGVYALGANIFNMAIIAPLTATIVVKKLDKNFFGVFAAVFLSVVAAAFSASIQLSLSGVVETVAVLAAMMPAHAVLALVEALAARIVIKLALTPTITTTISPKKFLVFLALSAIILSPFASSYPDGLEKTAEKLEFSALAKESMTPLTVMADYLFPGIENEGIATSLAGMTGAALTGIVVYGAARKIRSLA